MQIQGTNQNNALWAAQQSANSKAAQASDEDSKIADKTTKTDTFIKSSNSVRDAAFEEPKRLTSEQLKEISEQRIASFTKMMEGMFGKQVDFFNKATYDNLSVDPKTAADAKAAIGPGGEWSSDAVAERLLDMAKALSGGDSSKIGTLRNAVEKGFQEAAKAWGGKLPGICDDTYDKVMKGFDEWEKEGQTSISGE